MSTTKAYPGFEGQQKAMRSLEADLGAAGFNPHYFIHKFGIDCDYFSDWLRGDIGDFAELVVLYLPQHVRTAITTDVTHLRSICH